MRNVLQPKTWDRGMRLAVLAAGVMGLSGCMAGYSYVQPGIAGAGGYYTGDAAYPAYYDGGGYAYGSPYSLSVSIGNGWGPGYYGGYGYGYAYPSYYRGQRGNWHGGHDHHAGHQGGGHNWRPSQSGSAPQPSSFAPASRAYARPAPSAQQPANQPSAPSVKRR
jgi:hypothetical protein